MATAAKLFNLARMTTNTVGTGTITLAAAQATFLTFAQAGVSDQDTVTYAIQDGTNREIGHGVYSTSGTTLTRGPITSTNSNAAISLSGSAAQVFITACASDFTTLNGQTGAVVVLGQPGGRLTLTSLTPVLTTSVTGAGTVYYTPYIHSWVLIYDGTNFIPTTFSELSQTTIDTAHSPAAVAASKNYDVFVWNDSGTIRATRGPAWTNDTTRSLSLERINGIWLNQASITNGPAADRGTWVGTIRSNGSSTIDYIFGSLAAGGGAASFGVWNLYNRRLVGTMAQDSNGACTTTSTTFVPFDAAGTGSGLNNRVSYIVGLSEDAVRFGFRCLATNGAAGQSFVAIGIDSTSVGLGMFGFNATANASNNVLVAEYVGYPGIGPHYAQALVATQSGTGTFYGQLSSGTTEQMGLSGEIWM